MTGKIVKGIAGFYYVHDGQQKVYECRAKGVFRNRKIKPLVGDNVEFEILDEEAGTGSIVSILERKNSLIRPAVSNIDQALVVFAITEPMPNLNLLDRFLVMMERQNIPAVICFNKIDLSSREEMERLRSIYAPAGYEIHFISTYEEAGLQEIHRLIQGKTTVLAGPSGVGKSSLTNLLQEEISMETGEISKKLKRGKHTTRHSQLITVGEQTYLMDTPGFSSLFVEGIEKEELRLYFPEFREYEGNCRFQGCVHVHEPGCCVKEAVEKGKISSQRYENYVSLYEELKEKEKRRY